MYELFPQLTSINFHSFRIATLEMFKPLPKLFQQVAKGAADEVLVSLASKKNASAIEEGYLDHPTFVKA
jgi:hypothetical protein